MTFLDPNDFSEIRSVLNEAIDTFAGEQITIKTRFTFEKDSNELDPWKQDVPSDQEAVSINLQAVIVYDKGDAETVFEWEGAQYHPEGYLLMKMDALETASLLNADKKIKLVPIKDEAIIKGETCQIIGLEEAGQLYQDHVVAKVYFKRKPGKQ